MWGMTVAHHPSGQTKSTLVTFQVDRNSVNTHSLSVQTRQLLVCQSSSARTSTFVDSTALLRLMLYSSIVTTRRTIDVSANDLRDPVTAHNIGAPMTSDGVGIEDGASATVDIALMEGGAAKMKIGGCHLVSEKSQKFGRFQQNSCQLAIGQLAVGRLGLSSIDQCSFAAM